MIKDNLKYANLYYGISEGLKQGFEWLKHNSLENMSDGKYNISENIYANIQSYETKDNALYEAHRKYIDIQYMISGEEFIGQANYLECEVKEEYDKEKDIEFLEYKRKEEFYKLKEGEFFVFFPTDAHKPSIKIKNKKFVKKVVVKVLI